MESFTIIKNAIRIMPQLRYIYGVLALFTVVSSIYTYFHMDMMRMFVGAVCVLMLMVLITVFIASLKVLKGERIIALTFVWGILVAFMLTLFLLISFFFFNFPSPNNTNIANKLQQWFNPEQPVEPVKPFPSPYVLNNNDGKCYFITRFDPSIPMGAEKVKVCP